MTDERLGALRAPAGLDLGAQTPPEIAISILAELVQVRRGRASFVAAPGPAAAAAAIHAHAAPAPATDAAATDAVDPVCGMDVEIATARHIAQYEGTLYYFCSVGCRARFMRDPASYVGAGTPTAAESE